MALFPRENFSMRIFSTTNDSLLLARYANSSVQTSLKPDAFAASTGPSGHDRISDIVATKLPQPAFTGNDSIAPTNLQAVGASISRCCETTFHNNDHYSNSNGVTHDCRRSSRWHPRAGYDPCYRRPLCRTNSR